VERILNSRAHPQQGYRACLGILRLYVVSENGTNGMLHFGVK